MQRDFGEMPQWSSKKTINSKLVTSSMVAIKANEQASEANASSKSMPLKHASDPQPPDSIDNEVARGLAKMSKLIKDTSEAQDRKLDDIKRSTSVVETPFPSAIKNKGDQLR